MRILKYPIYDFNKSPSLELPSGSKILSFQAQHNLPYIWVLVSNSSIMEIINFKLLSTGFDDYEPGINSKFIGTTQIEGFVWHLFEDGRI